MKRTKKGPNGPFDVWLLKPIESKITDRSVSQRPWTWPESQGRSFVLSGIAQHVVEGVLHYLGVLIVAGFLGQDSGEVCDGVGFLSSQDLVQADAVESLGTALTAQAPSAFCINLSQVFLSAAA